jgi:N-acetylglucosaminyldiphosphoundecaprenol N-acetyl-beta-D-mannosaminyltransferase
VKIPLATPPVVLIEGVPFAALRMHEVVNFIIQRHSRGYGGWVETPNIDIFRRLLKDSAFRTLVSRELSLFTADGVPIIWLSHLLGTPLPERVAGSDLLVELISKAALIGKSVYLLGGIPGVAEIAAETLQARYPDLRMSDYYAPFFGFEKDAHETEKICRLLETARPDIVFAGLGSPKQEQLIASLRGLLPSSWWLGIGASFSFVAGNIKRAPIWMRKAGLEWLHRVVREPNDCLDVTSLSGFHLRQDYLFEISLNG